VNFNNQGFPGAGANDPVREALKANRHLFAVAFAFSAAISVLALTGSLYMLQVYDRVLTSRSEETLLLLTLIAFGSLVVLGVLDALRLRLLTRAGICVGEALSARVLRAMVATSAQNGGAAARHGLRDIDSVRNFIGSAVFAGLLDAPFLALFLVILLLMHWVFFAIVLVGGAVLVAIALLNQALTSGPLTRSMAGIVQAHTFADDGLHNADVLEGMGMSSTFVGRWRRQWLDSLRMGLTASDNEVGFGGASKAVRQLIQIALLGAGALLVLDFHATGGVMIASSILGARALAPIESTVGAWKSIIAVRLAWGRLRMLLAQAPRREEGMALPAPSGHLQVQRVSYVVPVGRRPVLSNVSFELKAGESLGIIGPSAAGKSTLMRLLIGAWPCAAGAVRLDGGDIYAWPRQELSRYIGYLPQDVELFSGSVRENIARLTQGDPEDIVRAAKLAHAHEMILALPNGYDTDIGEQGHRLSGGQRQRIGLARSLYGDPRLVALDEPNSNLDAAGEEALMQTLLALKQQGVTVAVVAHRPMILDNMDKMLALRDGMVEAFGPRAEIMQRYAARGPQRTAHAEVRAIHPVPGDIGRVSGGLMR
jgi:PrtD family type I secretion system ABC transporter